MFQLIYASTATHSFDKRDLRELVERARERNAQRDITGMLVHRNGSFLHVMEGTEESVRALYDRICEDDRHQWITLLKVLSTEQRDFPEAPLAFQDRSVAGARQPAEGGSGTREEASLPSRKSAAHETLLQFQRASSEADSSADSLPLAEDSPEPGSHSSASEIAAS